MNYNEGKIYKIEALNGDVNDVYIGSTTKHYLCDRMSHHRHRYREWKTNNNFKYTSFDIFEKYGVGNCRIVLIENYPCKNKEELLARELHYIKTLNCVNRNIPLRTNSQYYIDNASMLKEKSNYRYHNLINKKEKLACECGCVVTSLGMTKHKKTDKHKALMNEIIIDE
jgi:hypothetical protein